MNGTRALLRIAWRESWRHKRRSALVIALVAFPVAIASGLPTAFDTTPLTNSEERTIRFGAADMRVYCECFDQQTGDQMEMALEAHLPPGSLLVPHTWGIDSLIADGRSPGQVEIVATDARNPMQTSGFDVSRGRVPRSPGEVAVSPNLAHEVDIELGDSIELVERGQVLDVVGFARDRTNLKARFVLSWPGVQPTDAWLVDLPRSSDAAEVISGFREPLHATTIEELSDQPPSDNEVVQLSLSYILSVFVFMWTGVVSAAAFAIGARRRLREIGLAAANGATRRQVRWLLMADAAVLGFIGSLTGVAVGVPSAWFIINRLEDRSLLDHDSGGLSLPLPAVLGAVALGTVASIVAGLLPAVRAARIPATEALQARMPRRTRHVRSVAAGAVFGSLGVFLIVQGTQDVREELILPGLGLVVLAFGLVNRLVLVVAARLSSRAGLGLRFATRDAERNAQRSGPAVVAAMVALAGTVGAVSLATSFGAAERDGESGPGANTFKVGVHELIAGQDLSVVVWPVTRAISDVLPDATVTPKRQDMGYAIEVALGRPPGDEDVQRAHAAALREVWAETGGTSNVNVFNPGAGTEEQTFVYVIVAVGSVVSLLVLGLVAALSRAETRREMSTLHALGISPPRRRRLAGAASGGLALVAGVLATPTGIIPAVAYLRARNGLDGEGIPIVVPWLWILAVVLGVALILMAGGWLTAGRHRRPAEPGSVFRL